jgi:hypothetical protein
MNDIRLHGPDQPVEFAHASGEGAGTEEEDREAAGHHVVLDTFALRCQADDRSCDPSVP